jgi:hypothetical protein
MGRLGSFGIAAVLCALTFGGTANAQNDLVDTDFEGLAAIQSGVPAATGSWGG